VEWVWVMGVRKMGVRQGGGGTGSKEVAVCIYKESKTWLGQKRIIL
jgi:hypothetical protein